MIGKYELDRLRKEGKQVITPDYVVTYNPFCDEFSLDVPEHKKEIAIRIVGNEKIYQWNASSLYPVTVNFNGDYNEVKSELEPYIEGASLSLLPTSYVENGSEYVWLEDSEFGEIAVRKDDMIIIQ